MSGPSPLLDAGTLANLATLAQSVMTTPALISRGGVLLDPQPTMPNGAPLLCRVREMTRERPLDRLPRQQEVVEWAITFPVGIDIRINDSVTCLTLDRIYQIVQVLDPRTIDVQITTHGYITATPEGRIVQGFITNATIGVSRPLYNSSTSQTGAPAPVSGLSAVPVYIEEIGEALRAQGLAPAFDLRMLWDSSYDIRDGDQITGYNPTNATIPPLLQVSHAATQGLAMSWEHRAAGLIALRPAGSAR